MAHVPEIVVAAVGVRLLHGYGEAPGLEIGDLLLAALDVPDPPRRYDLHLGGEGLDRQLEAHLVVALARAAVGDGVAALGEGDLGEALGDEGAGGRGAQEVAALVGATGLDEGPQVVLDEFLL